MNQATLARELGISGAMVTKLAKRGMPVHSVEAASAWRRANLDPARSKAMARGPVAVDPVERAEECGRQALYLMGRGDRTTWRTRMAAALADVPHEARDAVRLPVEVLDAMLSGVLAAIPAAERVADMGEAEAEASGALLYAIAAGEPI